MFAVTVLGSNSAIPTANRFPTSQLLNVDYTYYLIDCGEGTQIQLRKNKIKMQRISCIFISHMHGDHIFGLIGLLNTFQLYTRTEPIKIIGPKALKDFIVFQLGLTQTTLDYPLEFIPIQRANGTVVFEDKKISVTAYKMNHRIECWGYVFEEKEKSRNLNIDALRELDIPVNYYPLLKAGNDYTLANGEIVSNEKLTIQNSAPKRYVFFTDTRVQNKLAQKIEGADLLYHEATFAHDLLARAKATYHSTTVETAKFALKANVKKLMIGHYSSRYTSLNHLLEEVKVHFENSVLAIEDETYEI